MTSEEDRLRRELRAMAAVNRQLQAQLDEPRAEPTTRPRRATQGGVWIDRLLAAGQADPKLVKAGDTVFVVEGNEKRAVGAGLIAAALEQLLGAPREVSESELSGWSDGVPVELFEAPDGPPFVVIGAQRRRVRGVPLPYPVSNRQASSFPEGEEINVASANVSRRRYQEAQSVQFQVARLKQRVKQDGVLGTTKTFGRRLRKLVT